MRKLQLTFGNSFVHPEIKIKNWDNSLIGKYIYVKNDMYKTSHIGQLIDNRHKFKIIKSFEINLNQEYRFFCYRDDVYLISKIEMRLMQI
jgi:hypothetical protein